MNPGGAFNLLALLASAGAFWEAARRRGLATEGIFWVYFAGLMSGIVGASLLHVALVEAPRGQLLGGKSLLGGLVCGWLGARWMKSQLGITRPTGDLFALSLAAGEAVGRWGCFFGGCCYGLASTWPWAVYQHGCWRHPTQLYQSLAAALGYVWLRRLQRSWPEGSLFFLYLAGFGAFRFALEFWREGHRWQGLTLAQWYVIPLFVWGTYQVNRRRQESTPCGTA